MRFVSSALVVMLFAVTAVCGFQAAHAQDNVDNLSDLVGAKAGQAENTVKERGYQWLKTDKSAAGSYGYWTELSTGKCVISRTDDGRFQSFVYAPKSDCEMSDTETAAAPSAGDPVEPLADLVGANAGQAENAIKERGYTWVKTDKQAAGVYSYWTEDETGECVTIRTEDGKYQSIVYAGGDYDCQVQEEEVAATTGSADAPYGSYQETCRNYYTEGKRLLGECKNDKGNWVKSSFKYKSCKTDIWNNNGELTCKMKMEDGVPAGSYKETCRNYQIEGKKLFAECQDAAGSWRSTSFKYKSCASDIYNNNGELTCDHRDD